MIATHTLRLELNQAHCSTGRDVLRNLLTLGRNAFDAVASDDPASRFSLSGCLRGTGPGASFTALIDVLERDHPLDLVFPFEGSDLVGGACWLADGLLDEHCGCSVAKLHWRAGALDLPIHAHTQSERFIIVLEGRGFHHVSPQSLDEFDGSDVRTVAARAGDVFMFSRNVVHTFSTANEGMTLISCHLPHIPFDDPQQYTLPAVSWTAGDHLMTADVEPRIITGGWETLIPVLSC